MMSMVGTREVPIHRKHKASKLMEMPKLFSELCEMTHRQQLTSSDVVDILLLLLLA